jgi:BASS family bile acid:Na+ symporter
MMNEILQIVFKVSILVFIVSSMLSMGFNLTVKQIIEPLKNVKLLVLSLIVNFILVPLLVYGIISFVPLNEGERIAMLLISIAAGAPFIPKLADIAKGDIPFSIGLMLLLMVVTVFFMPLVIPYMLSGVEVSSWEIAKSLIVTMLLPLILALFIRAYWERVARLMQVFFANLTNIAMLLLIISLVILNTHNLIAMIGYPLLAILLLLIGAMLIGYYFGGKEKGIRIVSAFGAGQRNISAALLVATQNFDDPDITIMLIAVSIFGLFIMMPYAKKMGAN